MGLVFKSCFLVTNSFKYFFIDAFVISDLTNQKIFKL